MSRPLIIPDTPAAPASVVPGSFGRAVIVAVIGPPAAGKSTLTAGLIDGRARVFRLREYARDTTPPPVPLQSDPLGWLPDDTATALVADALTHGRHGPRPGKLPVLEGYPGNAHQATHLARWTREHNATLGVLELTGDRDTCSARADGRRVCSNCEPDPRRPARHTQGSPACCRDCGHRLERRRDDAPDVLAARRERFDARIEGIRRALDEHCVPLRRLGAAVPMQVLQEAHGTLHGWRLLPHQTRPESGAHDQG